MPKQETVPKGLALLKGLSIFDPSEEFISGFRHRYWSQLDAFESDEKLLWIGAPDFRFFFVSFGNAQVYLVYAMALFIVVMSFFDHNPVHTTKNFFVYCGVFGAIILCFFVTFLAALSFIGITYALTEKKLYIMGLT